MHLRLDCHWATSCSESPRSVRVKNWEVCHASAPAAHWRPAYMEINTPVICVWRLYSLLGRESTLYVNTRHDTHRGTVEWSAEGGPSSRIGRSDPVGMFVKDRPWIEPRHSAAISDRG
jgi:hypothetical protein